MTEQAGTVRINIQDQTTEPLREVIGNCLAAILTRTTAEMVKQGRKQDAYDAFLAAFIETPQAKDPAILAVTADFAATEGDVPTLMTLIEACTTPSAVTAIMALCADRLSELGVRLPPAFIDEVTEAVIEHEYRKPVCSAASGRLPGGELDAARKDSPDAPGSLS